MRVLAAAAAASSADLLSVCTSQTGGAAQHSNALTLKVTVHNYPPLHNERFPSTDTQNIRKNLDFAAILTKNKDIF